MPPTAKMESIALKLSCCRDASVIATCQKFSRGTSSAAASSSNQASSAAAAEGQQNADAKRESLGAAGQTNETIRTWNFPVVAHKGKGDVGSCLLDFHVTDCRGCTTVSPSGRESCLLLDLPLKKVYMMMRGEVSKKEATGQKSAPNTNFHIC